MTFDPSKRSSWRQEDVDRAQFRYNLKLYAKVLLIVAIPWALLMWLMLEYLT
jgi:hypothetical protein